jgi:serine/threonine-protein kinase
VNDSYGWDELLVGAKRRIGTTLKNKWHIDELIGCGGMAAVFAATHRNRNRAAVKMLWPQYSCDLRLRSRFLREGYLANSVPHPGVVKVFDDDVADDGAAFLIMELLEGATVAELRKKHNGKLPVELALSIMDPILDVLVTAHEHGIVHRDIKPSNVFVTREGTVKLLDFGIARVRDMPEGSGPVELTATGFLLGSAPFMSPEQARAHWSEVDARSDIFSVGATLFHMITGEPVHEAVTEAERLAAASRRPARSIAMLAPELPAAVVAMIDRALAFERDERWQDARSMQNALRASYASLTKQPLQSTVMMTLKLPDRGAVPELPTRSADVFERHNRARSQTTLGLGSAVWWLLVPFTLLIVIGLAAAGLYLRHVRSRAEPASSGITVLTPDATFASESPQPSASDVEPPVPSASIKSVMPSAPQTPRKRTKGDFDYR